MLVSHVVFLYLFAFSSFFFWLFFFSSFLPFSLTLEALKTSLPPSRHQSEDPSLLFPAILLVPLRLAVPHILRNLEDEILPEHLSGRDVRRFGRRLGRLAPQPKTTRGGRLEFPHKSLLDSLGVLKDGEYSQHPLEAEGGLVVGLVAFFGFLFFVRLLDLLRPGKDNCLWLFFEGVLRGFDVGVVRLASQDKAALSLHGLGSFHLGELFGLVLSRLSSSVVVDKMAKLENLDGLI